MAQIKLDKLNGKLQKFLHDKKQQNPSFDIDKFLNPSINDLHDPLLLFGMSDAKARVEKAILNNEQVLIYGDYDCDGIVASTILYLYLKKRGLVPNVYIPNRFDDGYGLSLSTIDEIQNEYHPNLIITVDLGITAINEVEEIKSRGIDIVITDHHEMADSIPDTIVIDPKIPNQQYPFAGLCGAGVALKLVQALGGIEEVKEYLDIASLATIGDIVPLVDENRAIAKLGLDIINSGKARKSVAFMLEMLGLTKVTSTDVAFKIVPRVNASGRMAEGKVVFEYFAEENEVALAELFARIESDNAQRLTEIQNGNAEIENVLSDVDFEKSPVILLCGNFHQGVLGILSSRICHDLCRPTICFSKTDYGTYKGSGRSIDGVDLHKMVTDLSYLCIRCGGHKMAIGLEIHESKFDEFKTEITKLATERYNDTIFLNNFDYSIEIDEKDINKKFIDELNILEPFGSENEKPVFMLRCNSLTAQQMPGKSFRHYKFVTPHGKHIVAFNSSKYVSMLEQNGEKELIVDLETNEFRGKFYPQALLKSAKLVSFNFGETRQENMISSLMLLYKSFQNDQEKQHKNISEYNKRDLLNIVKKNTSSNFSHVVVVDNAFDYKMVSELSGLGYTVSSTPMTNKQNIVLVRPEGATMPSELAGYNKIFYTRRCFESERLCMADHFNEVFEPEFITKLSAKINTSREVLGLCFVNIKNNLDINAVNVFEWAKKMSTISKNLSPAELVFALLVFAELEILSIDESGGAFVVTQGKLFNSKQDLQKSKVYSEVLRVLPKK